MQENMNLDDVNGGVGFATGATPKEVRKRYSSGRNKVNGMSLGNAALSKAAGGYVEKIDGCYAILDNETKNCVEAVNDLKLAEWLDKLYHEGKEAGRKEERKKLTDAWEKSNKSLLENRGYI